MIRQFVNSLSIFSFFILIFLHLFNFSLQYLITYPYFHYYKLISIIITIFLLLYYHNYISFIIALFLFHNLIFSRYFIAFMFFFSAFCDMIKRQTILFWLLSKRYCQNVCRYCHKPHMIKHFTIVTKPLFFNENNVYFINLKPSKHSKIASLNYISMILLSFIYG